MRPASDLFHDALTRSHTLAVRADLLFGGVTVQEGLLLSGGSVTLDRTAEIRGRCSITVSDPSLIPDSAFDPVTPFGAELQLWRGINFGSDTELVSLGIFGIQEIKTDDKGGTVTVDGFDRAQAVKDAELESTYVIPAGTNYAAAIQSLIDAGVPNLTYRFASVDEETPLLVFADDTDGGRWAAALSMATSIGCDLYFDGDGRCVLEPVPDPRTDPVASLSDGPGGVVVSAAKNWSRAQSYNAVIAYSSNPANTGAPPRAVVRDLDPTSPTYYYGPFGQKPRRFASPLITTTTQAQSAASGMLRQVLGVAQSLDLTAVPNPTLEPGDIITVRRQSLALDEVDVLDSLTIPLDVSGTMSAGVRARQVTT